jgi:hypothetical protein
MSLFGVNRVIEYIEREINNIEYAKEKEEIRKHGTNTMVLCEKFLKELLYTYIYYFDKDRFYSLVNDFSNTEEILMFGKILNELNQLHHYIKDNMQYNKFYNDFNRNFVVFRYKDKYLDILYQCSRVRAMLLHDGIKGIGSLKEYKDKTTDGMNKALQAIKYFKENKIFPNIAKCKDYVVAADNKVLMNFTDEIGSVIPI